MLEEVKKIREKEGDGHSYTRFPPCQASQRTAVHPARHVTAAPWYCVCSG